MAGVLKKFDVKKALVVTYGEDSANVVRASGNIPNVKTLAADCVNVYDLINYDSWSSRRMPSRRSRRFLPDGCERYYQKPVLTEAAMSDINKKYTFLVDVRANKHQIRKAVEKCSA